MKSEPDPNLLEDSIPVVQDLVPDGIGNQVIQEKKVKVLILDDIVLLVKKENCTFEDDPVLTKSKVRVSKTKEKASFNIRVTEVEVI